MVFASSIDQYPGLIYCVYDLKEVPLIFRSRKLVCAGANREKDVNRAIKVNEARNLIYYH
jgi:TATA-box binding protein (TBP) (component of TFIID and TFIIIB)